MKADPQTEAAIKTMLDTFADDYAKRDLNALMSLFASDPDVVNYGTGPDEKLVGRDALRGQAERDWSQSDEASFTYGWTSISSAGPVAWVATDVTYKAKAGGEELTLPARLTAVFENRDGKWLIVQSHLSLPASAQAEGDSFPT